MKVCVLYIVRGKAQQKPPFKRDIERGKVNGFGKLPTSKNRKWVLICCACSLLKTRKGRERKRETEHNDLLPKKGNPLNETVCYKIGGTIFEIETSCGGSELLYDKMTRLIKAETVETPADKKSKERYNSGSNLFVGRSLQEE